MTNTQPTARPLYEIATDIKRNWRPVSPYAKPYLDAMSSIDRITDNYGADSAKSIVAYFLSNAAQFKGEDARRIKTELKKLAGIK